MNEIAKTKTSNSCEQCGKSFSKPALLRRHLVVHSKEKPFSCDSCDCSFSQQSSLLRHVRIKHNASLDSDSSEVAQHALAALKQLQADHSVAGIRPTLDTLEEQPPCQIVQLNDRLNPQSELHLLPTQRILRQHHSKSFYVCEYCAKEFSKSYDLIRHRRTHTKETPYPCSCCLKRFGTLAKLNEHQSRLHATMKKHSCSECDARYSSRQQLYTHISKQHDNLVHNCGHCNRSFLSRSAFEAHKKLEEDGLLLQLRKLVPQPELLQRSYLCIYCEQKFTRKFNCRTHMFSHLRRLLNMDPPPPQHSCLQCGKNFQKPSDLHRHLLTHSKLKLHACPSCHKRFTLQATLSRHLQTHQPQRKPIKCQVCCRSYASKAALQLHLRLHTGERPFSCEICGETFRTSGHRLEHMRAERHKNNGSSNAFIVIDLIPASI